MNGNVQIDMVSVASFITTYFNYIFILNAIDIEGDHDRRKSVIMKTHIPSLQILVQSQQNKHCINSMYLRACTCFKLTMETAEKSVQS